MSPKKLTPSAVKRLQSKLPDGQPGYPITSSAKSQPKTFDSKCEAICQDYAKKFNGDVLRWRIEEDQNVLVILFMDGRKFYFPIPEGWRKAS